KIDVLFQSTEPYEQFTKAIFFALTGGLIVSSPYVLWEIWRFIKPGLHPTEVKRTRGFVGAASFLFLAGVLFGYFVITPFSIRFLASFKLATDVQNVWRIGNVISMIAEISLAGGLLFEMPVVAYFLSKLEILTPQIMRTYRRHAIIVILIVAGILTPPDPISQILLGVPMYALYELSIFISASVQRKVEAEHQQFMQS
ncbi:MAG: twin-arginine translocase subunit TatC, partial [Bacteroidia bacterium]|nr:twin-arginine translocase subunit TatC [Bacteroidia bacterium]